MTALNSVILNYIKNIPVSDVAFLSKFSFYILGIANHQKVTRNYCTKCDLTPFKMKVTSPNFNKMITEEVKYLQQLFEENGYEIKIAGGAVRDLILGNLPKDLDFATTATPNEMKEMFVKKKIRLINERGESHGTVTPRINTSNFEITTLRIDKVTDGRHANVEFTKSWCLDAGRRDLTVNAMFLDFDGTVIDYFNGYEDLKNRRVRFVGDAATRIQEDYLRILRYFRFYGRISDVPDNYDESTLNAIRENGSGLQRVSGERIQMELFQIINGNYGIGNLKKIISLGLNQYMGLPTVCNFDELDRVVERIKVNDFTVEPVVYIAALLEDDSDVKRFTERIKPSSYHRDLCYFIVEERTKVQQPIEYYRKLLAFSKSLKTTQMILLEFFKYMGYADMLQEFENWEVPLFPLNGTDIMQMGLENRQQIGFVKHELHSKWIDSNYNMTKEEMLDLVQEIASKYEPPKKPTKKKKLKS